MQSLISSKLFISPSSVAESVTFGKAIFSELMDNKMKNEK